MNKTLKDKVRAASPKIEGPEVPKALVKPMDQISHETKQIKSLIDSYGELKFDPNNPEQSAADYQSFDNLLSKIQQKRKWWEGMIEPVIRPMRQAVDAVYELNRKIDRPMAALEDAVKATMKRFKQQEINHTRRLEEEKAAEQRRLDQQALDLAKRQEHAATPQMKGMLEKKRQAIIQQRGDLEEMDASAPPIQAAHSETRMKTVWKARMEKGTEEQLMKLICLSISHGKIPVEAVTLDRVWINQFFREHPEQVMEWPGFVVEEEPIIAGRR